MARRAHVLSLYSETLLSIPRHASAEEVAATLDAFMEGIPPTLGQPESSRSHDTFIAAIGASATSIKERAQALAVMTDDDIINRIVEAYPGLTPSSIRNIERTAIWAVAEVSELSCYRYTEADEEKQRYGGLHLNGTPISLVATTVDAVRRHELIHNIIDASDPLSHGIPALRVKESRKIDPPHGQRDFALVSLCVDDLHEELVAELFARSEDGVASLLSLFLECAQESPSVLRRFSTAGVRLYDAVRAASSPDQPHSLHNQNTLGPRLYDFFFKQAEAGVALLTAAALCGGKPFSPVAMLLYVTKPHQWESLRGLANTARAHPGLDTAYTVLDRIRNPWGLGNLNAINQFLEGQVDADALRRLICWHATSPAIVKNLATPEQLAEAGSELTAFLGKSAPVYIPMYIAALNRSFDELYPQFFPERANSHLHDVY